MPFDRVAIIGSGLAGLSLSLALKKQGIASTIYELRSADITSEGALMLSPNALKTLDTLGVYERIKDKGYHFRDLSFRTNEHRLIDTYEMGNVNKYGYDALRIYRQVLLDAHKALVHDSGIPIVYGKKFSHVVAETNRSVTFAFSDGEEQTVDLLIGADGIHSSVRSHVVGPEVKPKFGNVMAITCALPTSAVNFPFKPYQMPVSIHGSAGAFVLAPQNPEGSELLGGIQYRTHERDRAGWDALWKDKDLLLSLMKEQYDSWNDMIKSALDAPVKTLSIWPFYMVPALTTWLSKEGRVIILGDAAHAIPPTAGQGINQAFEDVHALSLVMSAVQQGQVTWNPAIEWWQRYRMERVARVTELTNEMNRRRLPGWHGEGEQQLDASWLFGVDISNDVKKWLAEQQHATE